jgi:hypothetical protein
MNTRRDFLSATVKGSATAVATALLSRTASAASASDTNGSDSVDPVPVLVELKAQNLIEQNAPVPA